MSMNRQLQKKKKKNNKAAKPNETFRLFTQNQGQGQRQMTTETDRQSRQPFFLIPCLGFSISLYLSLFLRLVAICVKRKRKFSEYEMAFIPFQTLGACSLPRSPSSPILPTPSPACLLFITFILISLKLSHKLKFVLSLFSSPLLCLAHKWQTKIFYVHPKLSKYCSPPAILVLLCLSFFSPLLASRSFFGNFIFAIVLLLLLLWLLLWCLLPQRLRFNAHIASYRGLLPTCQAGAQPANAFALSTSSSPSPSSSVVVFRLLLLYLFSEAQKRVAVCFVAFVAGFIYTIYFCFVCAHTFSLFSRFA